MFDYEVKIAKDQKEIEKALKLRYEIFNLEMGKVPTRSFSHDRYSITRKNHCL